MVCWCWPSDGAIALIKEAGLPVRLSFKRAPMSIKGLFGGVAGPSSTAGATAATQAPSFSFGVQKTSSEGSGGATAGVFKFGSGSTATASTSSSSFSFGVTQSPETTTENGGSPDAKTTDGLGGTAHGDEDGDAKE